MAKAKSNQRSIARVRRFALSLRAVFAYVTISGLVFTWVAAQLRGFESEVDAARKLRRDNWTLTIVPDNKADSYKYGWNDGPIWDYREIIHGRLYRSVQYASLGEFPRPDSRIDRGTIQMLHRFPLLMLDARNAKLEVPLNAAAHWPYLEELDLAGVQVTKEQIKDLAGLDRLNTLLLGGCGLDDDDVVAICNLRRLEILHIENNNITSNALREIRRLVNIKHLNLSGTRCMPGGARAIGALKGLTALKLNNTNTTDDAIRGLSSLQELEYLFLNETRVTDACVPTISKMPSLKWVQIQSSLFSPAGESALSRDIRRKFARGLKAVPGS